MDHDSDVKAQLPALVRDLQAHLAWVRETDPTDLPRQPANPAKALPEHFGPQPQLPNLPGLQRANPRQLPSVRQFPSPRELK